MMIRKLSLAVLMAAILAFAAAPAFAQIPAATEKEMAEAFAKEAPLTTKDLDAFIVIAPKFQGAMSNPEALKALLDETGLTAGRLQYIGAKVPMAIAVAMGTPKETMAQVPAFMMPTDDEVALVTPRQMELAQAMAAMAGQVQ